MPALCVKSEPLLCLAHLEARAPSCYRVRRRHLLLQPPWLPALNDSQHCQASIDLAHAAGRPHFKARNRLDAEAFFLSALHQWRQEQGLDKMILMGHSLGGYLAATYALQHPENVQHLILVCPAGIVSQI